MSGRRKSIPNVEEFFIRAPALHKGMMQGKTLVQGIGAGRYLEVSIYNFIRRNREMLNFLGINMDVENVDGVARLIYHTSRYVGAIPTLMIDGMPGGDIQVYPRFGASKEEGYEKLIALMMLLDYAVEAEFRDSLSLKHGDELRIPMYFEAAKFIELYDKAIHEKWRRFRVEQRNHTGPKGSTDWKLYAKQASNPRSWLIFPSRDNILSVDHPEWRQIKYAFTIAEEELTQKTTPAYFIGKYYRKIAAQARQVQDIPIEKVNEIVIRGSDPVSIQNVKKQANVLLAGRNRPNYHAWRVDIASLFERYVQYVFGEASKRISGEIICNGTFAASGDLQPWGLFYLEPDILIRKGDRAIVVDAKYKANMYVAGQRAAEPSLNSVKDEHRRDVHQVLSYSSFIPQKGKMAVLCYPAEDTVTYRVKYHANSLRVCNQVLMVGIPFDAATVANTIQKVYEQVLLPWELEEEELCCEKCVHLES